MVKTSVKYKPLYDLLFIDNAISKTNEPTEYQKALFEVDTVIITGGRYSAKSYEVAEFAVEAVLQHSWKIAYCRFTNESMEDSVISEVEDKIDSNGFNPYFKSKQNKINCTYSGGVFSFKGIKTSDVKQSAKLKGLKDYNVLVVDEAEEIPDYEVFQKVHLSIRHGYLRNLSVLMMNPHVDDFWLFERYFEERGVPEGYNGIKENVLYIHTSYLDVDPSIVPDKIYNEFQRMKLKRPEEYNQIVMGGWISSLPGALFPKDKLNRFTLDQLNNENIEKVICAVDPADRGTDSVSAPVMAIAGDQIFVIDWYFSKDPQEITIPGLALLTRQNNVEEVAVETNGLGLKYYESLSAQLGCYSVAAPQAVNKHSRIVQNSSFVKVYVYFRNDYEPGSMYDLAMREFCAYNKDVKINNKNTTHNDDAPDGIVAGFLYADHCFPGRWA